MGATTTSGGPGDQLGLGSFPVVTLAEARKRALANMQALAEGKDPRARAVPTFRQASEKVIRLYAKTWKRGGSTERSWRGQLEKHVLPVIGSKKVSRVETADIMNCLKPLWGSRQATAKLVHQRIGSIMEWCIAEGHRPDNPAGKAVVAALPRQRGATIHHRAVPHADLGRALNAIDEGTRVRLVALGIRFMVLTASRPGEVTGMTWDELDDDDRLWTLPAGRMKAKVEHQVPLSPDACAVLGEARELGRGSDLVFPGRTGRKISPATFSGIFRRLGIPGTPHGCRSSFRDWAAETGVDRQVAEACLAHVVKGVEGAYMRTTMVERRAAVMQRWAEYLELPATR